VVGQRPPTRIRTWWRDADGRASGAIFRPHEHHALPGRRAVDCFEPAMACFRGEMASGRPAKKGALPESNLFIRPRRVAMPVQSETVETTQRQDGSDHTVSGLFPAHLTAAAVGVAGDVIAPWLCLNEEVSIGGGERCAFHGFCWL
jgi:hypothetical protein